MSGIDCLAEAKIFGCLCPTSSFFFMTLLLKITGIGTLCGAVVDTQMRAGMSWGVLPCCSAVFWIAPALMVQVLGISCWLLTTLGRFLEEDLGAEVYNGAGLWSVQPWEEKCSGSCHHGAISRKRKWDRTTCRGTKRNLKTSRKNSFPISYLVAFFLPRVSAVTRAAKEYMCVCVCVCRSTQD